MTNGGFAKVVVRNVAGRQHHVHGEFGRRSLSVATAAVTEALRQRDFTTPDANDPVDSTGDKDKSSSGLTPVEVGLALAVLFGLFVIFLIIGELCKVFNKPTKEAAPYVTQKPFQPSAAGYGTRAATQQGGSQNSLKPPSGKNFGSRASLLANSSPMGYVGSGEDTTIDTSLETPSAGSHGTGAGDYFGSSKHSSGNGHTRGQSSGIQLPGATAASSRKGGPSHPALVGDGTTAIGPDGGGFTPGQPVSYSGYAGPAPSVPRGPGGAPSQNIPSHARVGMGRPPAMDAHRKSRYSRAVSRRIDSMGPGQLRKSVYMGADDDPMNSDLYASHMPDRRSRMVRKVSSGEERYGNEGRGAYSSDLRRVDSVGKGDARRKSVIQSTHRASRAVSVYNANQAALSTANGLPSPNGKAMSASSDARYGPGLGRGDPLGARNPNAGPSANGGYLSAVPMSDQRSRSGSGSGRSAMSGRGDPFYDTRSPTSPSVPPISPGYGGPAVSAASGYADMGRGYGQGAAPSAGAGNGGFKPGALIPSTRDFPPAPGGSSGAYPGGGAPRMRPTNQGFGAYSSPVQAAGGYDRGGRQVV